MLSWLSVLAVGVVGLLFWNLSRRFGADRIAALNDLRRPTSSLVSRGQYVEGNRYVDVALSLNPSAFLYENPDLEAKLDLQWINEIEYDTRLATGHTVESGKVLRLRCASSSFEFLLPEDTVSLWNHELPPRSGAAFADMRRIQQGSDKP
jgi:hypothetical protein